MGRQDELGSIEAGKQADLVLVDLHSLHNMPVHDPVANLVYSANQSDVTDVWLAGQRVMQNGAFTRLNEGGAIAAVEGRMEGINSRAREWTRK